MPGKVVESTRIRSTKRPSVVVEAPRRRAIEVGRVLAAAKDAEAAQKAREGQGRLPPAEPPVVAAEQPKRPLGPFLGPLYAIEVPDHLTDDQVVKLRRQWEAIFAPYEAPKVVILTGGAKVSLYQPDPGIGSGGLGGLVRSLAGS